jgi:nucleoid-associated protein Lsr2
LCDIGDHFSLRSPLQLYALYGRHSKADIDKDLRKLLPKAHLGDMIRRPLPAERTTVASRVVTVTTDDLDGTEAAETIAFSLEGASYEIDLSNAHAEELRSVLEPYMKAGRKTGGRKDGRRRSQGASADKDQIKAMRDWAKKQGLKVSDRGRVSADVREAYDKAH